MQIQDFIIKEDMPIRDAIKIVDTNGWGIAFVCQEYKLIAVLSDGDIRRYVLREGDMKAQVRDVANYHVKFIRDSERYVIDIKMYFAHNKITAVPVVDAQMELVEIIFAKGESVYKEEYLNLPLVIMAGGKGTRLYPYTQILPKPLIPIGDKTITEHILDRFHRFGCDDVRMIVNYKKHFIETYFADEEESNYQIQFVEEDKYLGTGGGLRLLQNMDKTFFMTNCDILIEADYSDIVQKHWKEKNLITVVCAKTNIEIPYGTVELNKDGLMVEMREKPSFSVLTNTGFYVIEPQFIELIPQDSFIHITDVIQNCIKEGKRVGAYIINEECWMDMGQLDELERMKKKIGEREDV